MRKNNKHHLQNMNLHLLFYKENTEKSVSQKTPQS